MNHQLKYLIQFISLIFLKFIRQIILLLFAITLVSCEKEPSVDIVIVSPSSAIIKIGETTQLKTTIKDRSGNILKDRIISWSSDNAATATVSSSGIVTGVSEGGPVKITAICEGKNSTAQITVIPAVASLTISTSSLTIEVRESKQILTTLKDSYNNIITGRTITWSSSNEEVATVSSSGIVTGKSEGGPVLITANCEEKSSTIQVLVTKAVVASVLLNPSTANIIICKNLQFSAAALDGRGVILGDRTIVWSSSKPEIATISSSGFVTGLRSGSVTLVATSDGKDGTAQLTVKIPSGVPSGVGLMFDLLSNYILWGIGYNQSLLENNPHLASQINTKIQMLQNPSLKCEIIDGNYYSADNVKSVDGRIIPLSAVFAMPSMRPESDQSIISIKSAMPIIENFMSTPYPFNDFYDWIGFNVGNIGGSNSIFMWEKEGYDEVNSTNSNPHPYEATLFHEFSHGYIGNEGLNQFLHIYLYNMVHTNSPDINSWIYLQGYIAFQDSNTWVYALLDIYQLIGHDNMSRAYKILYSLKPPYGRPLSTECLQVFIDQAPTSVKEQVAAKVAKINP
jgi:uncharacterized protein YjdB